MAQRNNIYSEIAGLISQGDIFVLAMIVATKGSSPRRIGARMLIFTDGKTSGTIGGGIFEKMVIDDAMLLLDGSGVHLKKTYRFVTTGENATGMNCGGEAEVFMERLGGDPRLTIFGAGHIGTALAKIATTIFRQVTIVDDLQDNLDNSPNGTNKFLAGSGYSNNLPDITANSYIVLVTRGHETDLAILHEILKSDCKYIGMIGSRSKMARMKTELEGAGFKQQDLLRIKTPIGLDIGADGPDEIAVAILAEIIAVKNGTLSFTESDHGINK